MESLFVTDKTFLFCFFRGLAKERESVVGVASLRVEIQEHSIKSCAEGKGVLERDEF